MTTNIRLLFNRQFLTELRFAIQQVVFFSQEPYNDVILFQGHGKKKNNINIVPEALLLWASSNKSFIYLSILGHISSIASKYCLLSLGPIYGDLSWTFGEPRVCNLKDFRLLTKLLSWIRSLFNSWFPVRSGFYTPPSGLGCKSQLDAERCWRMKPLLSV